MKSLEIVTEKAKALKEALIIRIFPSGRVQMCLCDENPHFKDDKFGTTIIRGNGWTIEEAAANLIYNTEGRVLIGGYNDTHSKEKYITYLKE